MAAPRLRNWVPTQNLRDDAEAGGALCKLIDEVYQPAIDALWADEERFGRQIDPDTADANTVGAMLLDLGCPFPTALALPIDQQRLLVRALLKAYKQFGTAPGLIYMVRALTGVQIDAIISPAQIRGWVLGRSVLGNHPDDPFDPAKTNLAVLGQAAGNAYSFQIAVSQPLSTEQRTLIREIVRQVKPAHTHFYGFVSTTPPSPQWSLGVSKLDEKTNLG